MHKKVRIFIMENKIAIVIFSGRVSDGELQSGATAN